MDSNSWWKTMSLFLWLYNTIVTGIVLLYFYGICRLAEQRFKGRTNAILLLFFFILMGSSTLIYSMSNDIVAIKIGYAVWPAIAGVLLFVVVYRVYGVMMKR
jgi:multidrug transporter EmrE-like cation transporter